MKKCKYCKSEIDKDAKICPNCRKSQKNPIIRGICIFFGIIFLLGACSAFANDAEEYRKDQDEKEGKCYATIEKFNKIENDMTYEEVVQIMGCEGTLDAESSAGDQSFKMYHWYADNGVFNMNITVHNGKVSAKAQIGLDK